MGNRRGTLTTTPDGADAKAALQRSRKFRVARRLRAGAALIAAASMVFFGVSPALAEADDPSQAGAASAQSVEASDSMQATDSTPPAGSPSDEAPAAPDPAPPAPVQEDPPAQSPLPDSAQSTGQQNSSATTGESQDTEADDGAASVSTGPETSEDAAAESPDPEPPYARWVVTDGDGAVLSGVALQIQGPRDNAVADDGNENQWADALTATVADNTGQDGYVGADEDPRPGHFTVTQLVDDADAERTHDIHADDTTRVQPTQVPDGFTTDAERWQEIDATNSEDEQVDEVVLERAENTEELHDTLMPMAIGPNPANGRRINVNVDTLRSGNTAPTAGIQYRLHRTSGDTYNPAPVNETWATCTTDADGDCTFYVPSSGTGSSVRYWVVPHTTQGAGSFVSDYLVTGDNRNDNHQNRFAMTPVAYRTPVVSASTSIIQIPANAQMPTNSQVGNPTAPPLNRSTATSNRWANTGEMIATLPNPRYEPNCQVPIKVALIIDLSTSMVNPNNTGLNGAKAASRQFAEAFADTGAQLGIYSFGTVANPTVRAPAPITSGNLGGVLSTINNLSVSGTQYTNWDRGIEQIQGQGYDLAVMLTDGNPTRYRTGGQTDSWTTIRNIEHSMLSANLVKSQGTQMLTFGVGAYLESSMPQNLRAVTGPAGWSPGSGTPISDADYAITNQWSTVSEQLAHLASAVTCQATVQVHKQERGLDGTLSNGSGWTFTPQKTGSGTLSPSGAQVTNAGGTLPNPWVVTFTNSSHTANLQITESARDGFDFESVTCRNHGAVMQGVANAASFTLSGLKTGDAVSCTVINKKLPPPVDLTVEKMWVVNGEIFEDGEQPAEAGTAALNLAPLPSGVTNPAFGDVYEYALGTNVSIDETTATTGDGCRLDSQVVTSVNGQAASHNLEDGAYAHTMTNSPDPNTVTITNSVTCDATLTLVKAFDIDYGAPANTADWTLTANSATHTISGKTGDAAVTEATVAPGAYALSETGPTGYESHGWVCVDGTETLDLSGSTVTIPLGADVTCTVTNTDKPGAVTWDKVASGTSHALTGSEWKIVGPAPDTTEETILDCTETPCDGPDQDPEAGAFLLEGLDWGTYTVTETKAPPGYIADASFTFTVDHTNAGETINTGPIGNEQQPPVDLPLTGGLSTDLFTWWGIGITALAALAAGGYWLARRREQEVV